MPQKKILRRHKLSYMDIYFFFFLFLILIFFLCSIKMHEKRNTKKKDDEKAPKGAVPAYLLDRESQSRAKVLSNMIKQKRKEKAVSNCN